MAQEVTAFEKEVIEMTSKAHNDLQEQLINRLKALRTNVSGLLATSNSGATQALERVYGSWISDVEGKILSRIQSLSATMKSTAAEQEETDSANQKSIDNLETFIQGN